MATVSARTHSDDYIFDIPFDATPWFEQASDEDILELAHCEFGGDSPSDAVALFFEDSNDDISGMMNYVHAHNKSETVEHIGFECYVDEAEAMAWLDENRPYLATAIAEMEEADDTKD
jgi:hypothetical protein